jgi:hypothetical protein
MAETNATILIPDISGFTEFMTTTELRHSSNAIHKLIDSILNAVGEEYEILEIEGDAVLMIKKGPAPSQKEILNTCLRIFNAFHLRRNWMQQSTVCPCAACQAISNLTVKFIAHYGALVEMKVGRFLKHSGTEMIVAHRLMKNSIDNHEYVLMTDKLLQQAPASPEAIDMEWVSSSEEYTSIGKVDYRFALLNEARKYAPEPPALQNYYQTDDTPYFEITIAANFKDVYMRMAKIPRRPNWMPGLQKVEQDIPDVFVGSIHHCTFENYVAVISPLQMTLSAGKIIYAERCVIEEMNLALVYEFVFEEIDEKTCRFASRFMDAVDVPVSKDVHADLLDKMEQMVERFREYCEKGREL